MTDDIMGNEFHRLFIIKMVSLQAMSDLIHFSLK